MSEASQTQLYSADDPVSNVLKWVLLAVAVVSFALFAWATVLTYERAPAAAGPVCAHRRRNGDDG